MKSSVSTISILSLLGGGGSGGNQPVLLKAVGAGDTFPTARPDGSPLVLGDYVIPKSTETFPFTIGTITFETPKDTAVWTGVEWLLNANPFQKTSETPLEDKEVESLSKEAKYQSEVNKEVVDALSKINVSHTQLTSEPISDYVYQVRFDNYDYQDGFDYFESENEEVAPSGCTGIRVGNLHARALDWNFTDMATFIVTSASGFGHYQVKGFAGNVLGLTKSVVDSGIPEEKAKILPLLIADGVNEKGLSIQSNVVPIGATTGHTNEDASLHVPNLMVCRIVLDSCASVQEALKKFKEIDIYPSEKLKTDYGMECHWFLNDSTDCYAVEIEGTTLYFINLNTGVCTPVVEGVEGTPYTIANLSGKKCLTNFRIKNAVINADGTLDYDAMASLEPFGMGLERWKEILDSTKTDMMERIKVVEQSNAYDATHDPFWKTEYCGKYPNKSDFEFKINTDITNPTAQEIITEAIATYQSVIGVTPHDRSKGANAPWQTIYAQVINLENGHIEACFQSFETSWDTKGEYPLFHQTETGNSVLSSQENESISGDSKTQSEVNAEVKNYVQQKKYTKTDLTSADFRIDHSLGKYPEVKVIDPVTLDEVMVNVEYSTANTIVLHFGERFKDVPYDVYIN